MKPFVHLFNTPKNYYFYDVNRNENVMIEQDLYNYLSKSMYDFDSFVEDSLLEEKLNRKSISMYLFLYEGCFCEESYIL